MLAFMRLAWKHSWIDCQDKAYYNQYVQIVILNSAYKHDITEESIRFCLFNFQNDIVVGDSPLKRLFVGFDHRGIPLEIIAIDDEEHDRLFVIHAMKLRKQFYALLE